MRIYCITYPYELQNYEESGFNFKLFLLTISYESCVSYPRGSGLVGNSNHFRPIYLKKVWPRNTRLPYSRPLYTRPRGPFTCDIQIISLVKKHEMVQVQFTLDLEDLSDWMKNLHGVLHDNKWIMFVIGLQFVSSPSKRGGSNATRACDILWNCHWLLEITYYHDRDPNPNTWCNPPSLYTQAWRLINHNIGFLFPKVWPLDNFQGMLDFHCHNS